MTVPADVRSTPRLPRPGIRENVRLTRLLFSDPTDALDTIAASHDGMCEIGFGPLRVAVVGDPAAVREVLSHRADVYRWGHRFQKIGPSVLTGATSMLGSDGADHTRRRGAVQAAFTRQRINALAPMIVERTDAAISDLLTAAAAHPNQPVDAYPSGRRLIIGITLQALFGDRWSARVDEVLALMVRAQAFIEAPAIRQAPVPGPFGRRAAVKRDRRELDAMIDDDLAFVRRHAEGEVEGLIGAMAFNGSITDEELRDQVVTLVGAGFDTTASTLAWLLVRVAQLPEVRLALRAEADAAPSPWALTSFDYAGRVVRESLRLHPAGLLAVREAATDVVSGGRRIVGGTMVAWSPYLTGRDSRVWDDPLRFDPDRHLDLDDAQRQQTDLAWVPFGRGPHMCIGFALAQLELALIAARLAQRTDFSSPITSVPRPKGMIVNRPQGGAQLLIAPRPSSGP